MSLLSTKWVKLTQKINHFFGPVTRTKFGIGTHYTVVASQEATDEVSVKHCQHSKVDPTLLFSQCMQDKLKTIFQ